MGKFRVGLTSFLAMVLVVLATGCGRETVIIADTTRPVVVSTVPANGATGVLLTQAISATFSKALNSSTVNSTTFTVTTGGVAVAGSVTYANLVATFTPSARLAPATLYTATLTTGIQDTASPANSLASSYVFSFTTAFPPVVTSTVPANGATGVPLTQVLSANFSKTMNPATISSATFTVTSGGVAVLGTVGYSGTTATFTPAAPLTSGAGYTATITTGAQDTSGIALAANYIWSFTSVTVPPTVVATIPGPGATGVPLNQVLSATFSKAMKASTINATTFLLAAPGGVPVSGTVGYSGTTATFTPTAPLTSGTVYTATITTGAQDTSGTALAANYIWSFTSVTVPPTVVATIPGPGATGVPLNQVLSANFSKTMKASTINATTFLLTAPGGVPVSGTVSYAGVIATFAPSSNLAANTLYTATITTGAQDLAGNALASAYNWTFKTTAAPGAPSVISTTPINGASGVPINHQSITATFSSAMNPATINNTSFTLTLGGVAVAGVVTYIPAGPVATFTPAASLIPNSLYTATVTTGATDLAGTPLAANYVWTFSTGAATDVTPPTVISTVPLNNETNVPINRIVSATFSKALNPVTVNGTTFTLTAPGGVSVLGLVAYAGISKTATFTPAANLALSTLYTATITTGVQDIAGNALAANYVWTFTTGASADIASPFLTLTNPANSATGVLLDQSVNATFNKAMDPLSLTSATFTLLPAGGGPAVAAVISYDVINFIATLKPLANLARNTTYSANVTNGATDLAGNPLTSGGIPNPWIFTTGVSISPFPINLGSAILTGGMGSAGLTNQGIYTVINGNIATTGVSTTITGFHDVTPGCKYTETDLNVGLVNGTINTAPPPPTVGCPNEGTAATFAIATQAAFDTLTAYNALVAIPGGLDVSTCPGCGGGSASELGNRTLSPGVYKSAAASFAMSLGDLTLDAHGDANASWVFQMSTSLTVGTPTAHRSIILTNGAQAKNVYWQVGSAATINGILGGGTMVGTIIAQAGVSVSTVGVVAITTINGRALTLTGPTTIVNTVINVPAP